MFCRVLGGRRTLPHWLLDWTVEYRTDILSLFLLNNFHWALHTLRTIRQAFARRPTNLMLVLSIVDAAKSIVETAGDKDKRKASNMASHSTDSATSQPRGDASEADFHDAAPTTCKTDREKANPSRPTGSERPQMTGRDDGRIPRRQKRASGRRDTPGWRVWDAR